MNIQRDNMPLANEKQVTANDIVNKQIAKESNQIVPPTAQAIDLNAKYKFGDAEVSGEQIQNWASLGKLDSSERVQTERDRLRQEKENWLTEKAQREGELSRYKTQAELYSKQLETFQSLLPKQEEQSAIDQLFDQYEQPRGRRTEVEDDGQPQAIDTIGILRQALEAQKQDISKLIDSRLNEVNEKMQTVPSRDDITNITNTFTQQQQQEQQRQQAYLLTTQKMQEVEGRLVQQRGWSQEQSHDYSLLREQITGLSRQLDEASTNPQNFANLYTQIQTLDSQSEELKEKFDTESQTKQQAEQDVAMTPTFQPVNRVIRPDAKSNAPKYVTNNDYRQQQLREARDILKKHKITG